eukprot:9783964-Heterocapsa_arctica.AAC.1
MGARRPPGLEPVVARPVTAKPVAAHACAGYACSGPGLWRLACAGLVLDELCARQGPEHDLLRGH